MDFVFDASRVEFEEMHHSESFQTNTIYFKAPKEWVSNTHPECEHAEISIEYPLFSDTIGIDATVMISPTRVDEYGNGEDYDWMPLDIDPERIYELIQYAEKGWLYDKDISDL